MSYPLNIIAASRRRGGAGTPFEHGFSYRASSGYRVDAPGDTYVLGDQYPTTRDGVTFGWNGEMEGRNRTTAGDARLGGCNFFIHLPAITRTFRVDLPSPGTYQIRVAMGDTFDCLQGFEILDTSTLIHEIARTTVLASTFGDALGDVHTRANWPANNGSVNLEFSTSILNLLIRGRTATDSGRTTTMAYLKVTKV